MQLRTLFASGILATVSAVAPTALSAAHAQGYLTLSNYSGNPGSTVQVMGYGFMPNESIVVFNSNLRGPDAVGGMTDANGNFVSAITIPMVQAGPYTVNAFGQNNTGAESASSSYYINGYYPTAQPSSYYVLPGQTLSFSGNNFLPGETVSLMMNGNQIGSAVANGGNVSFNNAYAVPFSAANGSLSFQLNGRSSGMNVPVSVSVGTYYPQVNPSSYYVGANQQFNVNGSGFAPNEQVTLQVSGMNMTATADGGGTFNTNVMAPSNSSSFTIMATGQLSNASSQRTLTAYSM